MSRLAFFKHFDEFDLWEFTPDLFHAFPFRMERISWSRRIRCAMEWLVGYRVYYAKSHDKTGAWIGYCVISSGKNPRYPFSTGNDIIFGRYFIAKSFRGKHLAKPLLSHVLDDCGLRYEKAFAYLKTTNTISLRAIASIGARPVAHFDLVGKFRSVQMSPQGQFVLFEYTGKGAPAP